jgi:hypothetical protein
LVAAGGGGTGVPDSPAEFVAAAAGGSGAEEEGAGAGPHPVSKRLKPAAMPPRFAARPQRDERFDLRTASA